MAPPDLLPLLAARPRATDLPSAMMSVALLGWQDEPARPIVAAAAAAAAPSFGQYEGLPARIALLADGRQAQLLAPIGYRQADGAQWPVPEGAMLDGASIPRAFWTLIGGPFEGLYRDASIVHDHYCVTRDRPWQAVHRMFYEAMRCSGVGNAKAKIMYYAVYRFGPRWPEVGAAAPAGMASLQQPDDGHAASIEADAEAIFQHDLNLDEIDNLADSCARQAALPAPAPAVMAPGAAGAADAAPLERVRLMVIPGGRGTPEDADAVVMEAAHLPTFVIDHFERKRIRIVACGDGVTDFAAWLKGVTPRGWEATGKTWDDVPGTYLDAGKHVVIATVDDGVGRVVPTSATGKHGSANLVVHESLHGYDYSSGHPVLRDRRLADARRDDLDHLGDYEKQDGKAGLEETYAESGARFVVEPAVLQGDWPHLFGYWSSAQPGAPSGAPAMTIAQEAAGGGLGTAELLADGVIELDLRAEHEFGAIGHAVLRIAPTETPYGALRQHLLGSGQPGAPAAAAALTERKVPFRPMGR